MNFDLTKKGFCGSPALSHEEKRNLETLESSGWL